MGRKTRSKVDGEVNGVLLIEGGWYSVPATVLSSQTPNAHSLLTKDFFLYSFLGRDNWEGVRVLQEVLTGVLRDKRNSRKVVYIVSK